MIKISYLCNMKTLITLILSLSLSSCCRNNVQDKANFRITYFDSNGKQRVDYVLGQIEYDSLGCIQYNAYSNYTGECVNNPYIYTKSECNIISIVKI